MRRALTVAFAVVVAVIITDRVLYDRVLVPALPKIHSVPGLVWLAFSSPIWLVGLVGGVALKSWRDLIVAALVAAVATAVYESWAAHADQPGFGKSFAIEAPGEFWTTGLAMTVAACFLLLSLGRLVRVGAGRLTN